MRPAVALALAVFCRVVVFAPAFAAEASTAPPAGQSAGSEAPGAPLAKREPRAPLAEREPGAPLADQAPATPTDGCCALSVLFPRSVLDSLPLRRSSSGLFAIAPTVAENGRPGRNGGGSRMDNDVRLDGLEITNPMFGDIVADPSALTLASVRFVVGGLDAASGATAGMAMDLTRPARFERWRGTARLESSPSGLAARAKAGGSHVADELAPSVGIAGPLAQDRAWMYLYGRAPRATEDGRSNALGSVPDLRRSTDEWLASFRFDPSSRHTLRLWANDIRSKVRNDGIFSTTHPSAGIDSRRNVALGAAQWNWTIGRDSRLEAFVGTSRDDNGQDALTELGYRPAFDPAHPERMGQFQSTADFLVGGATAPGQTVGGAALAQNDQDFRRDQAHVTYGWSLADRHDVAAGSSWERSQERLDRRANGWGTVSWNPVTRTFSASYSAAQPPHTGRATSHALFLQDTAHLGRLTLSAGLRTQRDDYFGEAFGADGTGKRKARILTFDYRQELQPRLALALALDPRRGDRLTLAIGRYVNTDNKSLVRAASPTRLYTVRATFDATGSLLSEIPAAATQSKTVDAGLDPMHTDEVALGYAAPLGAGWQGSATGLWRRVGGIFEDVSADGLGNGPFHVAQLRGAYRRYTAVTLAARRPVDGRLRDLFVDASYTWSRLSGNWDIDFGGNSPFYNSSFLEDGPGVLLGDRRRGLLRGDRTHLLKILASARPFTHVVAGAVARYQSGGAWEARGLPAASVSSSSYVRYLEPAGSRRMPAWASLDLLLGYEIPFGTRSLTLEARGFNVFDSQKALEVDDRLILGRGSVPDNPNFGAATVTTAARAIVLSALLRF